MDLSQRGRHLEILAEIGVGYAKSGFFINHVNVCSCACQSANIQQQESRAVAVVLGLEFANIIHWPKLTIVGLASVTLKILKN